MMGQSNLRFRVEERLLLLHVVSIEVYIENLRPSAVECRCSSSHCLHSCCGVAHHQYHRLGECASVAAHVATGTQRLRAGAEAAGGLDSVAAERDSVVRKSFASTANTALRHDTARAICDAALAQWSNFRRLTMLATSAP